MYLLQLVTPGPPIHIVLIVRLYSHGNSVDCSVVPHEPQGLSRI